MRHQAFLCFPAILAVLLIIWGMSTDLLWKETREILAFKYTAYIEFKEATSAPQPKCSLSRVCPPNRFALHLRSGAANVVGPQICFEDKMIMSNVLNNVGTGLNIAVVNGENGTVEKVAYLNTQVGNPEDMLVFLKDIKPGMIVLVASFDDMTKKLTDEMREVFVGMGSTLIKSVKSRDNWVFVGKVGAENRSLFEKQTVNDQKTNLYDDWPEAVEVAGCFPKTQSDIKNLL